ncbi:MAG: DUF4232 domain-containing protein [Acidimicrobiales bacterium]
MACGRSTSAPPPVRPRTTATTTTVSPPSTSTSEISPTSSTAPGTPPPCRNGQVAVTALSASAGASMLEETFGFTNTSGSECTLTGFPGVAALNDQGQQILQAKRVGNPPAPVNLAPGQLDASANVIGNDISPSGSTTCPTASAFLVTPPNLTQSTQVHIRVFLPQGFSLCHGLQVFAVVPGTMGSG